MSSEEGTPPDPWELTRLLSRLTGRRHVRTDVRDAHGRFDNSYAHTHALHDVAPEGPWALPLTDAAGGFRYVCFDLDAKAGNPAADARRLTRWLDELAIAYLVCESGPTGGRHVWIALTGPADPQLVRQLADRARTVLPSLDIKPLSNPATGAVRPPLAPHRAGGRSRPLGNADVLLSPSTSPQQLRDLDVWLEEEGIELPPPPHAARPRGVEVDDAGHPHLTGDRRDLSPQMRARLAEAPEADTSATLSRIFLAAANARWRYADVERLARTAPALEHARTKRLAGTRVPRTEPGFRHTVANKWRMAVDYAAANPASGSGDDPTFPSREIAVAAALTRAQERADALPGLWGADRASRAQRSVRGSAAHRAVLDAMCLYMAQAVSLEVEADNRRLALDTGWGRTTVQTALHVLQETGWIVRTGDAVGEHGARFALSEKFSTGVDERSWSQGRKPAPRTALLRELTLRLAPLNHDAFAAPRSLGRSAGTIHLHLSSGGSWTTGELALYTGMPARTVRGLLHRLSRHRLAQLVNGRWQVDTAADVDRVAGELDVDGYLADRRRRYEIERIVWGRWQAEVRWMRQDHVAKRRARPHPTATQLTGQEIHERARYPRGPDNRADHRTARQLEAARLNRRALVAALEEELGGITP